MNTSNITNYKPKDFAELLGVFVKTSQRWDREGTLKANCCVDFVSIKKQIERDQEIAKEFQNGNKPDD